VFQQAIDTVLQSVRMENSTPGERVILADWVYKYLLYILKKQFSQKLFSK